MLLLSVTYAANVGGTATITGTPPNMISYGVIERVFGAGRTGLNFASWMLVSVPGQLACLVLAWAWLQMVEFRCCGLLTKKEERDDGKAGERVQAAIK